MTLYVDPPNVAAHGRLWSHLASDTSYAELHEFAAGLGIPRRGFERDHYDVPSEYYEALVAAGAISVSSRELVRLLTVSGLRRRKAGALTRRRAGRPLVRPSRLRPGDTVAVVHPAGPAPADRLAVGTAVLRSWGLTVSSPPVTGHPTLAYLADTDEARAAAFESAWCDPEVRAIFCARGGYGGQRMVDLLDYEALAEAGPKVLVGFSDVTALHQALAARLGVVTVHGPVVTSLGGGDDASREHLRRLLFEPDTALALLDGLTEVVRGAAEGVLVGGNLALLASGVGTWSSRPAARSIAVLEDVGEGVHRVDRMLTQLLRAGWFDQVAGVVVGDFTEAGDALPALLDRLRPLGVPLVTGAQLGHGERNLAVPFGVPARLDASAGRLDLLTPALQ